MPNIIGGFRIEGAKDAQGRVHKFSNTALRSLQDKASDRADKTVFRFKTEMAKEYTSKWATGLLARGITHKEMRSGNGIDVQFLIQDRRELRYVTAALGGYFHQFPVGPFVIVPQTRKFLLIPFPNSLARRFIRGKGGRFAGSQSSGGEEGPPGILTRKVIWGRRTGGFSRDVISEVAQDEGALFVQDMQAVMEKSIVRMTS